MRAIKFRGMDKYNKWQYGDLMQKTLDGTVCIREPQENMLRDHRVAPETVGQFTGLKDRHGKEIYEGDILSDDLDIDAVCFWDGSFCLNKPNEYIELSTLPMVEYEIIGNIYENPELLNQ